MCSQLKIFTGNALEFIIWEKSFRRLGVQAAIDESDKLDYVKDYVARPARECIDIYFLLDSSNAYRRAIIARLKEWFGSDFAVMKALKEKLDSWPKMRHDDAKMIVKFADFISQCKTAMEQIEDFKNIPNELTDSPVVMNKLPEQLATEWKRKVVTFRKLAGSDPKFHVFAKFIRDEADIIADAVMTKLSNESAELAKERSAKENSTVVWQLSN